MEEAESRLKQLHQVVQRVTAGPTVGDGNDQVVVSVIFGGGDEGVKSVSKGIC